MADCFCVPPDRAAEYWGAIGDVLIKPALIDTLTDYNLVAADVREGRALLWLAWDGTQIYAAAVTQLSTSNAIKFCTIVACGGFDIRRWHHLLSRIEQFAKDEQCSRMVIMGRKGWERLYPEYKRTSVTLEKELT